MASAPSVSKKRKRDDGDSCPRITYFAEGRTFERLFREETLDETLKVVQHKLGLDDDTLVILSQIRGEQSIDLDDDDDFEAFQALAYKTMAMSVRVRTKPKPKATTATTHIAHQATQSTSSSHVPAQSSSLASEVQRPTPLAQPQASSSTVTTQTPTAQIALSTTTPSVTTLPNGSEAPATEPIKRKPGRPKKVMPVYQPPALPDAPSASAQTAPSESTSTALSSSRVQPPSQDTATGTEQPPPKRQKRATIVEKAVTNPEVPTQQKAGQSTSSPTEAPASQAAIVPSAGSSATQTAPGAETTTKPKTKKKRAAEAQNTEAPPASAPAPQEQVVDVATTSDSTAPPKRRKTHKSRVLISETPEPSDSSEAPPAPATQPPKLIPEDPTSTSAPVKKVKKSSKKDNVESATTKAAAASATAPKPPVAEESASAPVRKSKRSSVREADNAENSNVRVITQSTGPSTTMEKTTKATGKKKAEISLFETLTDIACPICLGKPFHVRESCPIVLAGWRVLEPRLKELKEDDVYHSLIKSLEADLKKMKGKSTAKDAAQPQASTSISTERATRTSAKAPIPPSKAVALTNGLVGSSTKASQRPGKTQSKSSGPSATKSATVTFDTPLADVDISSINPEDLLKNPNSSRLAISDIESLSDDDDKDESPNDDILEEDSDNDGRPRTRLRRTRSQTKLRRRALDSSDDEDDANMAMDVDSPVSELQDIPLGAVDQLGQSQELDRRPDDLLSQIARSETVVPTIRASIEVEKDSLSAPDASLPPPILTQVPSGSQNGLPTPDQSSTPTSQSAAADLPPPSQLTNGAHDKSKAPTDPSQTTSSHSQDQSSSAIQPTTSKQVLSQIVSPSAESSQPRPLDSSQTSPAPKRNGHTKLSEAEKPQSKSKASSSKTKVAKDGKKDEKKIEKKGEKKTEKKGEKKSEKKSDKKSEKKDEKKPAKPVDKIPDPSSPVVDVDEGQSLAQWEILPRSESPPMDRSSQGVDELEGQDFDSVVASTPRNPIPPKDPLFLPTDSQFPAYPQTQSSQITARSPAESDDEAEVAEVVKRDHSRTSSSATAYRGLSAIASQRLLTPTIIRPPRFSLPRHANALSAKKRALYGEDEKSSSSSGDDSDDSAKAPSHIPQGKRAGAK